MSIFVYTHRRPLRTPLEFWVRITYFLVGFVMLTAFLVTFVLWVNRINDTFDDYWEGSGVSLDKPIFDALVNCTYQEEVRVGTKDIAVGVRGHIVAPGVPDSMFHLMTAAESQNLAFGYIWPTVLLSILNKVLFAANWWHLRWKGVVVRTNIILPLSEVGLHSISIVLIARTFGPNDFADNLVTHCINRPGSPVKDPIDHSFQLSFTAVLVVLCVNLGMILLALLLVLRDGLQPDNARWADVWYSGYHRNAIKGVPGPLGMGANDDIVPPKRALLRAIKYYPDVVAAAEAEAAEPKVVERRQDMADLAYYTRDEFKSYYGKKGGQEKWDAAVDTSVMNVDEESAPPQNGAQGALVAQHAYSPAQHPVGAPEGVAPAPMELDPRPVSPYHFARQQDAERRAQLRGGHDDVPPAYFTPTAQSRASHPPPASDV